MKKQPEPKKESSATPTAAEIMRDRLKKLKDRGQGGGSTNLHSNSSSQSTKSRLQNPPPRNKSQKTRKGLRPG